MLLVIHEKPKVSMFGGVSKPKAGGVRSGLGAGRQPNSGLVVAGLFICKISNSSALCPHPP